MTQQQAEPERTWGAIITQLIAGTDLGQGDTAWAMNEVMSGAATPVQVAGFLVALRAKGETVDEVAGLAEAMLAHAVPIELPGPSLDVVGTGGDRLNTVNISTMAVLVAAGAGARIVKHGNRAASSSTGSADVLERLGLRLDLSVADVERVGREAGITFCFAQTFHPAMRHAGVARRELGVATAFNFLGPLTNPAQPAASAIGVSDPRMAPVLAGVLAARGRSALVFRGAEGLDELSVCGPSTVWVVTPGQVRQTAVTLEELGLATHDIAQLRGGDPEANAEVVRAVLAGSAGPARDAVLLNAAGGLVALDLAADPGLAEEPIADLLKVGLERARQSIDSGAAADALQRWIEATLA